MKGRVNGMWIILGIMAITLALVNLAKWLKSKNSDIFRFASISLTALTVCAIYSADAQNVIAQDWSALTDVMPSMSKIIWALVIACIVLNGVTLLKSK